MNFILFRSTGKLKENETFLIATEKKTVSKQKINVDRLYDRQIVNNCWVNRYKFIRDDQIGLFMKTFTFKKVSLHWAPFVCVRNNRFFPSEVMTIHSVTHTNTLNHADAWKKKSVSIEQLEVFTRTKHYINLLAMLLDQHSLRVYD